MIAALRGGETRLQQLFADDLRAHPGRLTALDLHMERPETFAEAARLVQARFGGKLDALVNNAGYGLFGALEDLTEPQLRHQMEVNFFGPALLTRALLPALRAARGRVINLSSVAGRHSFHFYTAYNASKFALEGLSEAMHYELKPFGVQVGLIEPGGFKTDFAGRSLIVGETSFSAASPYRARSEALDHFLKTATPRLGDPSRVARLLVRSIERRRLPVRQPIGTDSHFMMFMGWLVPTRLRMWLVDRVFRLVVFRD